MKPLLSFSRPFKSYEEVEISLSEACSSVIAFGATGSGKTTGVLQPAFYNLVSQNCSGMVFDLKGDYLALARTLVPKERRVIIGTTDDSQPCNLLAGMSIEVFRSFMNNLKDSGGMRQDPYWGSGAVRDSLLIFRAFQIFERREPTLAEIYESLEDPNEFCGWLDASAQGVRELPLDFIRIVKACKTENFSILNRGCSGVFGDDDAALGVVPEETLKQYAWHTSVVCSHLRAFSENSVLRAKVCVPGGRDADVSRRIYEENAVVVVHIPATHFAQAGYVACSLLRERLYNDILLTTKSYRHQHGVGNGRFTFLMADEYQNFIKINQYGNHTGLIDDNTWFDKSRAYNHINILATQGITSLYSQVGVLATDSLLQNVRNKIYFPTDDPSTLKRVEASGGPVAVNSLICPSDIGHCFIHKASQNPFFGPALSGQSRQSGMNVFIKHPVEPSAEVLTVKSEVMVENRYSHGGEPHDLRKNVVLVCALTHEGAFQDSLTQALQRLHASGVDVDSVCKNLSIHAVSDFTKTKSSVPEIIGLLKSLISRNPNSVIYFDKSIAAEAVLKHVKINGLDFDLTAYFTTQLGALCKKHNSVLCLNSLRQEDSDWFVGIRWPLAANRFRYRDVYQLLRAYTDHSYHSLEEN